MYVKYLYLIFKKFDLYDDFIKYVEKEKDTAD